MLIRRRIATLVALCGAAAGLAASGPALAASAVPVARAHPAARAARSVPAASVSAAAAVPSTAGTQLTHDIQKAVAIADGSGVTLAVLSTGVDPATPGLAGRVTIGPDLTGSAHPVTIVGSLVASLSASNGSGGSGNGLAPAARILSVRTGEDSAERGSNAFYEGADIDGIDARAINYAVGHGAQVIFIDSLINNSPTQQLETAVHDAVARNVVIVGQDVDFGSAIDEYDYPSSLPGVIGIGSVVVPGWHAPFEHTPAVRNESVLVAGPGNTVGGLLAGGASSSIDGTEAAAAFVAATVTLIKSLYPHLSPMLVARALALSARYRPPGGYSTTLGFGLINPYGALTEAAQLVKLSAAAASPAVAAGAPAGQDPATAFREGPPLPAIAAVHHSMAKLAAYGAAAVIGLVCLIGAFLLRRSRARGATGTVRPAPGGTSEQFAEP